jgi:hypothetical protein
MPLSRDKKGGGSNADGTLSTTYCSKCFEHGQFTNPEITTAAQMQAFVMTKLQEKRFPKPVAWLFTLKIPNLKRWAKDNA